MGIHALMISLVLSRKTISTKEKVHKIFKLICFEVSENEIQKSEVKYVFHLLYNWIKATTRFEMTTSSVQESTEKKFFRSDQETVNIENIINWVGS